MAASPLSIEFWLWLWGAYTANREPVISLLTFVAACIVAWAALKQARTATRQAGTAARQAEIAMLRHEEQTNADRQRRISESFTKATEQLGSDKLQVRLGGIYTLERISRESEVDYFPILETLTAFIREQARWKPGDSDPADEATNIAQNEAPQPSDHELSADVAAILTVIRRREEKSRQREESLNFRLDLSFADLRGAILTAAHLERADLTAAHLEEADLTAAHLERALLGVAHLQEASLNEAHLERAFLSGVHLQKASLCNAHLEEADLFEAHLEGADLTAAHLERAFLDLTRLAGANLYGAHLEGANLRRSIGLEQGQIDDAFGDATTLLPKGLTLPAHWLPKQGHA